jgi:hypothetical protein
VDRPPLTLALTSVLAARMDGAGRPGLLAATVRRSDPIPQPQRAAGQQLAAVIPFPRVIPMPRRPEPDPDRTPDPAAA